MDTNETLEQSSFAQPSINLGLEAQSYLREAGKWAVFLGIIGFIYTGLIFIAAIFAGAAITRGAYTIPSNAWATLMAGLGGFVTVIYLLIALIYFFFSLYLYQFGDRVRKGIDFQDTMHLTNSLGKLKSFFKLWGIMTIILLCLMVLMFMCFIILGIGAASMGR